MKQGTRIIAVLLAAILLCGLVPMKANAAFVDVAEDAYYRDAVYWAVARGITTGKNAAAFAPNDVCTRAEAVTMLLRTEPPAPTDEPAPIDEPIPADAPEAPEP